MRPPLGSQKASDFGRVVTEDTGLAHHLPTDICKADPDLATVVEAWPDLPEVVRQSIMLLVKAASSR